MSFSELFKQISKYIKRAETKEDDNLGPDLFEFASMQVTEEGESIHETFRVEEEEKRKTLILILIILLLLLPIAYILGFFTGNQDNCNIARRGIIYPYQGIKYSASIHSLANGELSIITDISKNNQPADNIEPERVSLKSIARIDFFEEPKEDEISDEKKDSIRTLTPDEKRFVGQYSANVSGHKAILYIYGTKKGYLGAAMKFTTWGTGETEYLRGVRVNGDTITFRRICTGSDCIRIGSSVTINQLYTGNISLDRRKIDGQYEGGRNASQWSAIRTR